MVIATAVIYGCMFAFTAIGAFCDLKNRKIPNVLTVPVCVAGLLFHLFLGLATDGLTGVGGGLFFSLKGFAVGFSIMFVLWLIGGGGGGDVKFMGALGAWLGAWLTFQVIVLSAVISGIFTISVTVSKVFQMKKLHLAESANSSKNDHRKKKPSAWSRPLRSGLGWRVPYALPVAVGSWIIFIVQLTGHGLPWPPIK